MNDRTTLIRRIVIIVAANLCALGAFGFMARGIAQALEEYRQTLTQKLLVQNREEKLIDLKKKLDAILPERGIVDHLFISKEQVSGFVEQIEAAAFAEQVQISINTLRIDAIGGHDVLFVDYTLKGALGSINNQVQHVDRLPYVIQIQGVEVSRPFGEKGDWTGRITLVLSSYNSRQP